MRQKPQQATRNLGGTTGDAEREELDGLNAQLRGRRQRATLIRRRMEAQIEAKARQKRSSEQPASAALGAGTAKRRRNVYEPCINWQGHDVGGNKKEK